MSDCGVFVEVTRNDGGALSSEDEDLIRSACRRASQAVDEVSELGSPWLWRVMEIHSDAQRRLIILSEYWGEDADVMVWTGDTITRAELRSVYVEQIGEEVEMPIIPEGNPPAEDIVAELLRRDLASAVSAREGLCESLSGFDCALKADYW